MERKTERSHNRSSQSCEGSIELPPSTVDRAHEKKETQVVGVIKEGEEQEAKFEKCERSNEVLDSNGRKQSAQIPRPHPPVSTLGRSDS